MRKTSFKTLLAASLVVLTFLLGGAGRVQAQISAVSNDPLYGAIKATFVSSTEAEDILVVHLDALKAYMSSLPQGSPAYNIGYRASVYYRTILRSIRGGKDVRDAVADGLGMFFSEFFVGASYGEKQGLRQESINLLAGPPTPNPNTN